MESNPQIESKKRTLGQVSANDLVSKFKSKQDFIIYLDQQ